MKTMSRYVCICNRKSFWHFSIACGCLLYRSLAISFGGFYVPLVLGWFDVRLVCGGCCLPLVFGGDDLPLVFVWRVLCAACAWRVLSSGGFVSIPLLCVVCMWHVRAQVCVCMCVCACEFCSSKFVTPCGAPAQR